jgi:hypothetical protein
MGAPAHIRNKRASHATNGTTLTTIFTHGTSLVDPTGEASGRGGVIDRIKLNNPDTVAHDFHMYLIESGGTADETNRIDDVIAVPAGRCVTLEGPYYSADSAFLQAKLDAVKTTTEPNITVWYHEMASA